jgi:predicted PurR-regulated permease PerM
MARKRSQPVQTSDLQLGTRSRLRAFVLLGLTLAGLIVCFWLLLPFLPALVWALALAILFVPAHRFLETRLGNPNLAAAVSVLMIGLLVVIPVLLLSGTVIQGATEGAVAARDKIASGEWRHAIESNEFLAPIARWIEGLDLTGTIETLTTWLTNLSASFVSGSVLSVLTMLLTFYLLFYFLRDREAALAWLREISPLSDAEMDQLQRRVVDTVEATLYGTVVVAAVQGTLGGLMFWWLGLPMPVLWGLVMGLLAVVPMLGAFVIWLPAALFLAINGELGKAVILTVWGTVVVGGIDNLLYPILVKDRMRLHTVPAFIAIVGGLILFGASGLLLGPLVLTVTMFFLEIWRVPVSGSDAD